MNSLSQNILKRYAKIYFIEKGKESFLHTKSDYRNVCLISPGTALRENL
jgi:hypothetical protein